MTATCPFESLVATNTHEGWLKVEAQNMLNVSGLGVESLCTWQGSGMAFLQNRSVSPQLKPFITES